MEKLSVSYYLPEHLVSKIDERSRTRSANRSRQMTDDLCQFYELLDIGLHSALTMLDGDDLRIIIGAIHSRPTPYIPIGTASKHALMDVVERFRHEAAIAIKPKIAALDDISCFALWDWAITNR
jgi:hypothetical protein